MATCIEAIAAAPSASIPEILPGTRMPFDVLANDSQLYRIRSPLYQTVTFSVNLELAPYETTFTFYQLVGSTYVPIGSSNITQINAGFPVDLPFGEFILCIRSRALSRQKGSFVCTFTPYPTTAEMEPRAYVGEVMVADLEITRPPVECNEALFFNIVEGELPPGLILTSLGAINGVLPNLDCLPDRLSPAAGWYYQDNDEYQYPWGREWRFKVKLQLATGFATPVEEWFCIRINNNWDLDQMNFLSQSPFKQITELNIVRQPDPILPGAICEPCKPIEESPIPVLKEIEPPACPACEQEQQMTAIELIEIPVELCQVPVDDMVAWYDRVTTVEPGKKQCKAVTDFIASLDNSEAFQMLRTRAGYVEEPAIPLEVLNTTFVAVSSYDRFMQLATIRLDEHSDLTSMNSMIDMWREHENQVLPMRFIGWCSERMEVSIA